MASPRRSDRNRSTQRGIGLARGADPTVVVLRPVAAIQVRDPDAELWTHGLNDVTTTRVDPHMADTALG